MSNLIQWFREPFCEGFGQYYFIIIIIGLTFVGEALSLFLKFYESNLYVKLNEPPFPKYLSEITYKAIFDFAFFSAFSLITVDLYKIVFNLNTIGGWNVDAIIKFYLFINILISAFIIYLVTRYAIKEKSLSPSYPPEATIDSRIDTNDSRAIA